MIDFSTFASGNFGFRLVVPAGGGIGAALVSGAVAAAEVSVGADSG